MKQKKEYPGVSRQTDRHGKVRFRYRDKYGIDVQLGTEYGSKEFRERYRAAAAGEKKASSSRSASTKSLSALIALYYQSSNYLALANSTKQVYRNILEEMRDQYGHLPVISIQRRHVKAILEKKAETPVAANKLRHRLIALLDEAVEIEWIKFNPASMVKPMKVKKVGFHTWTEEEIEKYLSVYRLGSVPYAAMTLMLYTGAARVDAVKLGWQSINNGRVEYVRQKTQSNNGMVISIPVHPHLQTVLDKIPSEVKTFLETKDGQQRSEKGLGKDMRKWCNAAGLPKCSSHGLRKAIARRLAEAGATGHQIMSVTGHKTLSEVQRYTEEANRAKLANAAMQKMTRKKKKP